MALNDLILAINHKINQHARKFAHPYLTFAIFGMITYPLYYWIWKLNAVEGYENLALRLITVFLCLLLVLKKYWPKSWQPFFPLFWYLTLLYSLPFLFTFLLLKNHMSDIWALNTMTVLVLSILLLDLFALFILLTVGVSLGVFCFLMTGEAFILPPDYPSILISYASIVFFGAIFSYRKDQLKEAEERIKQAEADKLKLENDAHLAQSKAQAEFRKTASQVAHDIRSPVASLLMIVKSCTDIPEMERIALREAGLSISDIANNLLKQYEIKSEEYHKVESKQPLLLSAILLQIITDKKFQFADLAIQFQHEFSQEGQFSFILCELSPFKRMVSNLINNAVDALGNQRRIISIKLLATEKWVRVMVEDSGKGMNPELIEKIVQKRGITEGKETGHGIGLIQVQETLERNSGSLYIDSIVAEGTCITLKFPRIAAPIWIAEKISLNSNDIVVILDDDRSIHGAWDSRFDALLSAERNVVLQHFEKANDALAFIKKMTSGDKERVFLLTDFELVKQTLDGLDVVKQSAIKRSLLVTSHYMNTDVQTRAITLGSKILPKQLASEIPISIDTTLRSKNEKKTADVILVDDDKQFANSLIQYIFLNNSVDYFSSPQQLKACLSNYSTDVRVYLDNFFQTEGLYGLDFAKEMHTLGYKNLYLLSGKSFSPEEVPSYLTVIRKDEIDKIKDW